MLLLLLHPKSGTSTPTPIDVFGIELGITRTVSVEAAIARTASFEMPLQRTISFEGEL